MRLFLVIYVLVLVSSLTQAKRKAEVQKSEVTKLEVASLGEVVKSDFKKSDIQRKRDSGYIYNRPNRVSSSSRFRIQAHPSRDQIPFKVQLSRPFTKYGPPTHSTSGPATHGHHAQHHRNKFQYSDVNQQQSISNFGESGLTEQGIPSPIKNVDFAEENPIASQNDEPFGMHTANYLPPKNQELPAYSSDYFDSQSISGQEQFHGTGSQSQNFVQTQSHQISDAALFLSENAQAIQQLYGAPASNQDFAPSYDQFQNVGNQIHNSNGRFESTSQNPDGFRGSLPSYASGTLDPRQTLDQIQSLEKDRLIVQLQQALAQARTNPSTNAAERYAENQAGFTQNQELLASISQQLVNSRVPTTTQPSAFGSGNIAFSQSAFLPGTTINPLGFPVNYGVPTTTQTPTTTTAVAATGVFTTQSPLQPSKDDGGTAQVASLQPASNQPGSSATGSPAGIPVYGGFVPTFITGTNFIPSYSTSIFTSGPVRPVQSSETSPTHFGIPIPTEPPQKPASGFAPSTPTTTTPPLSSPVSPANRPGIALTPAITPVALPIQPIRPVAPLATPIAAPLLPVTPTQVHPAQTVPAVTSTVQHTYGVQPAPINSILYKPVKTVYPVYYYPVNIAYQLQKPVPPSYPWNYAPSYATQTGQTKIWK
ncbi:mucin-2 [Monomorium pharaonis]|uniref:mucin-2 n=1 Tax=Monomorium pharaonis TaxID=307658 RepID=UPI00063F744C|nr:mucin-2 [Monomorium pharaonis]